MKQIKIKTAVFKNHPVDWHYPAPSMFKSRAAGG
jgi:hypothetical protein